MTTTLNRQGSGKPVVNTSSSENVRVVTGRTRGRSLCPSPIDIALRRCLIERNFGESPINVRTLDVFSLYDPRSEPNHPG